MGHIDALLQNTFSLEMVAAQKKLPPLVCLHSQHSILSKGYTSITLPADTTDYRLAQLKSEDIETINLENWIRNGSILFSQLFSSYLRKEEDIKENIADTIKTYREAKSIIRNGKIKGLLSVILNQIAQNSAEQVIGELYEGTIQEIMEQNNTLANKVKPLATLAHNFIDTLRDFQQELRTQGTSHSSEKGEEQNA